MLLPLDSLDLFKLFVYKRVKPKQAIKRPFELVTHSSATKERDPKMVKQAVAATDSPSGATSSLRTSPLSIPNPKQLAQQARSLNVKDASRRVIGSSKNNASASPKPSRASKLLADSKNHNIFQDQDIDYEQIELNEAIASNQSIVRFEDVKKNQCQVLFAFGLVVL
ncbi:hypothetical protein C9374_008884 [Naegleria lovaniensis]|uniref:Uncharacterized protein n=1 Tax=Naegleria lovaniensis TaxID=51637 RepID=A0AA88GEC0_NAELO|nr:uncharacterized protein C9374_008884 [Naegleria lovaniensis]KAG2377799.1 hypothetical protein C9374_008884 [Naegleria lovaniensis]